MRRRVRHTVPLAMILSLTIGGIALAHPEHGSGGHELFPGEGVATGDKQHGEESGHLPPTQSNVTVIGRAEVSNPSGAASSRRPGAAPGAYSQIPAHGPRH
jgi:hypothetical protein